MMFKKSLFATIILLSFHAVFCMDYHDLYQNTAFFENIRTKMLQNPKDPFYLEDTLFFYPLLNKRSSMGSEQAWDKSTGKSSDSSNSDSDEQSSPGLQLKPTEKHKATTAQQQPKRIKTNSYTVICPECTRTLSHPNKLGLAKTFLKHKYSKQHDSKKFDEAKRYLEVKKTVNKKQRWMEIRCMHKNCKHTMRNVTNSRLLNMLMRHLYTSKHHNKAEIEEVMKYIEEQGKK